jgi:hypothetical protein
MKRKAVALHELQCSSLRHLDDLHVIGARCPAPPHVQAPRGLVSVRGFLRLHVVRVADAVPVLECRHTGVRQ